MAKKYLIINTGSTSKKYSFYEDDAKVYSAHFETEDGSYIVTENIQGNSRKQTINKREYIDAIEFIVKSLIKNKLINSKEEINFSGIRIVAPGEYFLKNKFIDKEYLKMAKGALEKVPLHLASALKEVKDLKRVLGDSHYIAGVSDSSFHATIPEYAKFYSIPIKDSRRLGLYRFGYHGISVQSVVSKAADVLGVLPNKVVVCHLGGGASVTAVKNGQSIDTSMGFTPLEGLVMATRVGDIDAGAVLYLSEKLKKNYKKLNRYFNNECGLLGLSGTSADIRELLTSEANGHADSSLALKIYINRVKQYIGRMATVLGGLDLIIFAGTVGERSFIMRERICENLEFLGVEINHELNNKSEGVEVELSKPGSKVKLLVVKTDEMEEIAKVARELANELT